MRININKGRGHSITNPRQTLATPDQRHETEQDTEQTQGKSMARTSCFMTLLIQSFPDMYRYDLYDYQFSVLIRL
jgi:hypothetical protein